MCEISKLPAQFSFKLYIPYTPFPPTNIWSCADKALIALPKRLRGAGLIYYIGQQLDYL